MAGAKKKKNETINGEVGNAYNPTIPAGYIPINTDSSKWGDGTTTPTTDAVDYGLVIKDKKITSGYGSQYQM